MARSYGSGSIKPALNKDGQQRTNREGKLLWKIRVCIGVDQATKNAVTKQETFAGTKSEAAKRAAALQVEYQDLRPEMVAQTFSGLVSVWARAQHIGGKANEKTIEGYQRNLAHMERFIGKKKVCNVTAADIESALLALEREGLGGTTRNKVFAKTKAVFDFGVNRGYIVRNPCAVVGAPRPSDPQRRSLTVDEMVKLLAKLDEAEAEALALFSSKETRQVEHGNLYGRSHLCGVNELSCIQATRTIAATGMRRGEACALCWGSVDLEAGKIEVCQSIGEDMKVKKPKTDAGRRKISIDRATVKHLAEWKEQQASILRLIMEESGGALFGIKQSDETPVFISGAGGYLDPSRFEGWWAKFRKAAGLGGLKLHELRHSQASVLLSNGVDIATVQRRLGHAKASTTLAFYVHYLPGGDEAAADLLGGLLEAKPKQPAIIDASAAFKTA